MQGSFSLRPERLEGVHSTLTRKALLEKEMGLAEPRSHVMSHKSEA